MQIKEAKVFNFGKLQNRGFCFEPGLNVIYGANETGKTTLHAFLSAMLFGMDKNRGRAAAGDVYTRYEPWHAPAFYSGALRFEVGGQPFYLERNFYHREKREILRNEADGEELSVAYGDLAMLLGGIEKETFGNTYDIPQCGVLGGKELARVLSEYLTDASESGEAGIHVTRAIAELEDKKKQLQNEMKKQQEEKQHRQQSLEMEQKILERDCGFLRREIAGAEKEASGTGQELETADLQKEQTGNRRETADLRKEQLRNRKTPGRMGSENAGEGSPGNTRNSFGVIVAAVVLVLIFVMNFAAFLKYDYSPVIFGVTELTVSFLFAGALLTGRKSTLVQEPQAGTNELLNHLREMLSEKETRLYQITEKLEEFAGQNEQERELIRNIQALELAETEICRLAGEYREEWSDRLNAEISRLLSEITQGRYDSVCVDERGVLKILTDGREIAPETLSRGALEQCYLAFRIAVGNIVTGEEPMPLFLDETFCMYDDDRLMQTLRVLSKMNRQVLLFTCQRREQEFLERLGLTYHMVEMK